MSCDRFAFTSSGIGLLTHPTRRIATLIDSVIIMVIIPCPKDMDPPGDATDSLLFCPPFGRTRIGAGIMSVDIIPFFFLLFNLQNRLLMILPKTAANNLSLNAPSPEAHKNRGQTVSLHRSIPLRSTIVSPTDNYIPLPLPYTTVPRI